MRNKSQRKETREFVVRSKNPPSVEFDFEAGAYYIRFRDTVVARTIEQPCESMILNIDLDADEEVIGIEAIGATEFRMRAVIESAGVTVPDLDYGSARLIPAQAVPA